MTYPTLGAPRAGMRLADRFDLLWGLPVHPMAASVAVVLLPLSSLMLVAIVAIPKLRRVLGWFVMILLAGSVGVAYIAQQSGAALAARLGRPQEHADLATLVLWFTAVQFAVGLVWFLTVRIAQGRAEKARTKNATADSKSSPPSVDPYAGATGGVDPLTGRPFGASQPQKSPAAAPQKSVPSAMTVVFGLSAVLVAALNLFLNWRVAESGMRATWEARIAGPAVTPSATPSDISPSVVSPSVVSPSVVSPSVVSPSVVSPGVVSPGVVSPGVVSPGVVSPGVVSPGVVSPGVVSPGVVSPAVSPRAVSPSPSGLTSTLTEAPIPDSVDSGSGSEESADTPYTRGDVAAHSRVESCWIIVGSRVYDLTGWLPVHPDSAATFAELCGTDITGVMSSQTMAALISPADLAKLQIGVLE